MLGIGCVLFIVVLAFLFLFSNKVTSYFDKLQSVFVKIASGDITDRIHYKNDDEVGRLMRYFNNMMDNMSRMLHSFIDESQVMSNIGETLSTSMNETASSVEQINDDIATIKEQILNQAASVTEAAATTEQIIKIIKQLADSIEAQVLGVDKSSLSVEKMVANVNDILEMSLMERRSARANL